MVSRCAHEVQRVVMALRTQSAAAVQAATRFTVTKECGLPSHCEADGYLLDASGNCQYIEVRHREVAAHRDARSIRVFDKTCLCTHMSNFDRWTCGHYTYHLKDSTRRNEDGSCRLFTAEHVVDNYPFGTGGKIALPE